MRELATTDDADRRLSWASFGDTLGGLTAWFVRVGDTEQGPLSAQQVLDAFNRGDLLGSSLVRRDDSLAWEEILDARAKLANEADPMTQPFEPGPPLDLSLPSAPYTYESRDVFGMRANRWSLYKTYDPRWNGLMMGAFVSLVCGVILFRDNFMALGGWIAAVVVLTLLVTPFLMRKG